MEASIALAELERSFDLLLEKRAARITQLVFASGGAIPFAALAASAAPNNSLFRDAADNKLKFKDNGGIVNALY
jgi:hypothetical protein